MTSLVILFAVAVAVANAAVVPLGYSLAPKIPITTTVPVVTNVPVTLPSCGCGLEVTSVRSSCIEPLFPPCGCYETVIPTCGCNKVLPAVELSTVSCGCGLDRCNCARTACLTVDPVTTCGCTLPLSLPAIDVIPSLNPFRGSIPVCGCGCGRVISACGCPTLPPVAPTVNCCGKYLRQVCVQPPYL